LAGLKFNLIVFVLSYTQPITELLINNRIIMIKQDTTLWDAENKKIEYNRILEEYRKRYKIAKSSFVKGCILKQVEKHKRKHNVKSAN